MTNAGAGCDCCCTTAGPLLAGATDAGWTAGFEDVGDGAALCTASRTGLALSMVTGGACAVSCFGCFGSEGWGGGTATGAEDSLTTGGAVDGVRLPENLPRPTAATRMTAAAAIQMGALFFLVEGAGAVLTAAMAVGAAT